MKQAYMGRSAVWATQSSNVNPPVDLTTDINDMTALIDYFDIPGDYTLPDYTQWLSASHNLWLYQSCDSWGCVNHSAGQQPGVPDPTWPSYAIDQDLIRARAIEWLSFLAGAKGELYWDTTEAFIYQDPWNDLANAINTGVTGPGDGTLFYPGTPVKIGGNTNIPIASMRLKMIREGMEDYEYLNILNGYSSADAQSFAASLFPHAYTAGAVSSSDLYDTRKKIACEILQDMGKQNPCSSDSPPPFITQVRDGWLQEVNPSLWQELIYGKSLISASGGILTVSPEPSNGSAIARISTIDEYRFSNSAASVELDGATDSSGGVLTRFAATDVAPNDTLNQVGFDIDSGQLKMYYMTSGAVHTVASQPYSSSDNIWLKIQESNGTTSWVTSPDGSSWSQVASMQTTALGFSTDTALLDLAASEYGAGNANPGSAEFSNLNIEPTTPAVSSLVDPFTAIDSNLWTEITDTAGSTVDASNGVLSLAPEPGNASGGSHMESANGYSLTSSSIFVRLESATSSSGGVNTRFQVTAPPSDDEWDNQAGFQVELGSLTCYNLVGGNQTDLAVFDYSPVDDAWLRFREADGILYWETSPDGATWTVQASAPVSDLSFSTDDVYVILDAKEWGDGSPDPGVAQFADLNVLPATPPVAALSDSFTGPGLDLNLWNVILDTPGSSADANGAALLTPEADNASGGAHIYSKNVYSLTNSAVAVNVEAVSSQDGTANTRFQVTAPDSSMWTDDVVFEAESGNLNMFYEVGGVATSVGSISYNATSQAWWRIREYSGTVYWETSSDGTTWTTQASTPDSSLGFSTDSVRVLLNTKEFGSGSPNPGTTMFGGVNKL